MGSTLSRHEACMVCCGRRDDAFPDPPVVEDDDTTLSLTKDRALDDEEDLVLSRQRLRACPTAPPTHENLWSAQELAPSTNEDLRGAGIGQFALYDVPLSPRGQGRVEEKKSPGDGMGEGATEGLKSFFYPDGDELIEDTGWSRTIHGPSLADLLQRVECLGNVDQALSEIRSLQEEEDRGEAMVRITVIERFLVVMGPEGPGLAVKKYQRGRNFGAGGSERGKWAARTIRFEPKGMEGLFGCTPLGGTIVWNSKRLFPREQRGVSLSNIAKVEHSGKCVWVTTDDANGRLGFETSSTLNARFLCRSINFLVSAAVQPSNHMGYDESTTSSLRSIGTNSDNYTASASYGPTDGV